jgi:ribosomal protein S27AE
MEIIKIDLSVATNSQACVECGKYEAVSFVNDRALCGDCEQEEIAQACGVDVEPY